jgi:hypothetical protein
LVVLTPDVAANRVSEPAEIGWSLVSTACGVLALFFVASFALRRQEAECK